MPMPVLKSNFGRPTINVMFAPPINVMFSPSGNLTHCLISTQAEAARLDDLLSDATQKKMKAERKLLAKLAKVSAKDEL